MSAFEELAQERNVPVLHVQRNDGVTIIATRIPLADVRLQQWGWIITQSYAPASNNSDDFESLYDNIGRRYPKVYTLKDMKQYIETWGCQEWNIGYLPHTTTPLGLSPASGKAFQEAVDEILAVQKQTVTFFQQTYSEQEHVLQKALQGTSTTVEQHITATSAQISQQVVSLHKEAQGNIETLSKSTKTILDSIYALQGASTTVENHVISTSAHLFQQMLSLFGETQKEFETLNTLIEENKTAFFNDMHTYQGNFPELLRQENTSLYNALEKYNQIQEQEKNDIRTYLMEMQQHTHQELATCNETIFTVLSKLQHEFLREITTFATQTNEEVKQQISTVREDLKTLSEQHIGQIQQLQEQAAKILDAVDPNLDELLQEKEGEEKISTKIKTTRVATTLIERIATNHQRQSNNYYNNANEQAKQGFKLAWWLTIISAIIFSMTIVATVIMGFLHLYGYTALLGTIGTIGSTIVATMGGLNFLQTGTAKQFLSSQQLLDRNYRSTVAYAMCVGYTDEAKKHEAIDKIIPALLANIPSK